MCQGTLDLYCLDCHRLLGWRKRQTPREDGYPDWCIEVFCGCGRIRDPELLALARAAYDVTVADAIYAGQEAAMEHVLGPKLHAAFNRIPQERP